MDSWETAAQALERETKNILVIRHWATGSEARVQHTVQYVQTAARGANGTRFAGFAAR